MTNITYINDYIDEYNDYNSLKNQIVFLEFIILFLRVCDITFILAKIYTTYYYTNILLKLEIRLKIDRVPYIFYIGRLIIFCLIIYILFFENILNKISILCLTVYFLSIFSMFSKLFID